MSNIIKPKLIENTEIMKEWDWEKNSELGIDPSKLTQGSGQKAHWICSKGHKWYAEICHRISDGSKCPYCSGRLAIKGENDLLTLFPKINIYWDYDKNKNNPDIYLPKSEKDIFWKCSNGHSWNAKICNFIKNISCPYCSGKRLLKGKNDLLSCYPDIASEWDYDVNDGKPEDYFKSSNKVVGWKCNEGHKWKSRISARTAQGYNCPYCSGKKASNIHNLELYSSELIKEWDYEKNVDEYPYQFTPHSSHKVWWKCKYGHSWLAKISNRVNGNGCPECKKNLQTSFPEQAIFYYIKKCYADAINEDKSYNVELDVFIPSIKTAIEYDGYGFHKKTRKREIDYNKNILCEKNGIKLIRVLEKGLEEFDNCSCIFRSDNSSKKSLNQCIKELLTMLNTKEIDVDVVRDFDKIYSQYKYSEEQNSISVLFPRLVLEWDYDKNGSLKPEMFSAGSGQQVWWKCDKGHSWKTSIVVRCKGHGCPICGHGVTEIKKRKKVICIETGIIYDSIIEASNKTGCNKNSIVRCCKKKQDKSNGYHWEYFTD